MLLIAVLECVAFNLPFWTTLAASTDTAAAENTLGPGLTRTDDGLLRVTDPTQAYLDVAADGTSRYARVDLVSPRDLPGEDKPLDTFHLRVDSDGSAGRTQSMSARSPRSLYLNTDADATLRVWVQEAKGALVPILAVRANERVPFSWSWTRVAALACAVLLVLAWRPGSRLWRTRLDPSDRRQRWGLAAALAPAALLTCVNVVWQIVTAAPLSFHQQGGYTYDFDQYAHVADALMHGRPWLDLPVPDQLASAANPYDIATRDRLLSGGVTPIYWDYAFHGGHWYSYFGVLPALLLFLPYRAVTSLFTDGGLSLPTGAAELLLMFGFLVFGCLLIIRLVQRLTAQASLAGTSMLLVFFLLATNSSYLWFRTNFYSIPIAASLLLTCLGLWLWLGAVRRPRTDAQTLDWSIDGAAPLSLPHLAGGALCIAANFGCRPTFALAALLGIALFWPQITSLCALVKARRIGWGQALRAPLAVLVPAIAVVAPLMAYNAIRFGGPLDFGSEYQLTVTDMTRYSLPAADIPYMAFYYLLLPARFTGSFPFMSIQPTPLPEWGFTEPIVGGLFMLCPLALAAFLLPRFRRRLRRPYGMTLMLALALGMVVVAVDVLAGGLGWRYMADFGWLFALAALPALLRALEGGAVFDTPLDEDLEDPSYRTTPVWRLIVRLAVMLVLLFSLAIMVLSCFVPGRDDSLVRNNPALFHDVQSWFTLLGIG
ncbi:MAG: hypothetical protein E7D48_10240 [Bifidobacterium scardovii]|uniref:hypothetical protein n=1 Tax=Bifidobacterium scardovii TaxID=158787 RepID=UPI002900CC4B|nr:hypothetical protein [Bifidobacterium scardovii]MDU2422458.1 hypothetical protein [Bifidobacterium scardovii]